MVKHIILNIYRRLLTTFNLRLNNKKEARKLAQEKRKEEVISALAKEKQDEQTSVTNANVYYENCTAVRAAGAAPVYESQPGYAKHLDRDGDGIGCDQ